MNIEIGTYYVNENVSSKLARDKKIIRIIETNDELVGYVQTNTLQIKNRKADEMYPHVWATQMLTRKATGREIKKFQAYEQKLNSKEGTDL